MIQDRLELMEALGELSKKYPHWRFGQLIANASGWTDVDVWDVEDEQLLAAAASHLRAQDAGRNEASGAKCLIPAGR